MNWIKKVIIVALAIVPVMSFADEGANTNVVWKRSIALGMTYKSGNTDQEAYTANLKFDRVSPKSESINSLFAEYGETRGVTETIATQSAAQVRAKSEYRYKFGDERFYGSANAEARHDAILKLSYRARGGPNAGYYFIQKEKMRLDASIGINYVSERFWGEEDDDGHGEYRAAGRYIWNITDASEFYCNAEYYMAMNDEKNSNGLLVAGLKSKIMNQLSLSVEWREEYDNILTAPALERRDRTIIAGLSYDF